MVVSRNNSATFPKVSYSDWIRSELILPQPITANQFNCNLASPLFDWIVQRHYERSNQITQGPEINFFFYVGYHVAFWEVRNAKFSWIIPSYFELENHHFDQSKIRCRAENGGSGS
eukprot:Lithocolla_globosa_v1_NODE_1192_length_2798_cov_5.348888.p2 type:complete len:116 gc:universal NODE_1192_length_2798_cov_5.348888:2628-2281(-)